MDRQKWMLLSFVLLLAAGCSYVEWRDRAKRKEIAELRSRLSMKSDGSTEVRYVRDTVPVYVERVRVVDRTDYKRQEADRELIRELGVRISELESENRLLLSSRDTVVMGSDGDSIWRYSDKWSVFSFDHSTGVLGWEVRDSLSAFVSVDYRHHFLWWRWGRKGYRVSIVSHNPHVRVDYSDYIRIE